MATFSPFTQKLTVPIGFKYKGGGVFLEELLEEEVTGFIVRIINYETMETVEKRLNSALELVKSFETDSVDFPFFVVYLVEMNGFIEKPLHN